MAKTDPNICDHCINQKCPVLRRILDKQKMVFKTVECSEHIDGLYIPDDDNVLFDDDTILVDKEIIDKFLVANPEFDYSDFGL